MKSGDPLAYGVSSAQEYLRACKDESSLKEITRMSKCTLKQLTDYQSQHNKFGEIDTKCLENIRGDNPDKINNNSDCSELSDENKWNKKLF